MGKQTKKVYSASATISGAAVGCCDDLWYRSEVVALAILHRDLFTGQLKCSTVILEGVTKTDKYDEYVGSVYGGALHVRAIVWKSDVTNQLPPLATVTMADTDKDLAEHLVDLGLATRYLSQNKPERLQG